MKNEYKICQKCGEEDMRTLWMESPVKLLSELDKYEHELAMLERLKEAYASPLFGKFLDDSIISTSKKIEMCKHLLNDRGRKNE